MDMHFHILAIVNNAKTNIGIEIPVRVPVFSSFGPIPRSGISICLILIPLSSLFPYPQADKDSLFCTPQVL